MPGFTSGKMFAWERTPHYFYSGAYKIEGQTLEDGEQVRRRVVLFPNSSLVPVFEIWSESDGTFSFTNLSLEEFIVLGIDRTGNRNAVVYSNVTPVAM